MDALNYVPSSRIPANISFSPFLPNQGGRNPRIKHAFIQSFFLDTSGSLPRWIRGNNGEEYRVVYNELVLPKETHGMIIPIVGSFQQWDEGNFAILRLDRTRQAVAQRSSEEKK